MYVLQREGGSKVNKLNGRKRSTHSHIEFNLTDPGVERFTGSTSASFSCSSTSSSKPGASSYTQTVSTLESLSEKIISRR